ncbi:hypothetical protein IMZ48_02075 [Candidatus Bathyarchaeota archaeon]|nr:hypothetical protein [Candidatus Bathyarchaeota archaeon]
MYAADTTNDGPLEGSKRRIPHWTSLRAEIEDARKQLDRRLTRLRKFRWIAADASKSKNLIQDIRFCNDDLWRLCPDGAADALTSNMIVAYLAKHLAQQEIPEISRDELQDDYLSPSLQGQEMLRQVVSLSAEVKKLASQPLTASDKEGLLRVTERDLKVGTGPMVDMAVLLSTGQTVFLERHSYTRDGEESDAVLEDILKLGRLLREQPVTEGLLSLQLHALVQLKGEIGFVYELPPTVAAHGLGAPSDHMSVRVPVPLSELLSSLTAPQKDPRCPPLGLRFELARKLVRAVTFLYASGWLHKNIRPESIVFFRKPTESDREDRTATALDLYHPYLVGYKYSRPEEVEDDELVDPGVDERPTPLPPGPTPPPEETAGRRVSSWYRSPLSSHENPKSKNPLGKVSTWFGRKKPTHHRMYTKMVLNQHRWRSNLDKYQHPMKRHVPELRYCAAFDVYSLGLVLLAIGLWSDLQDEFNDAADEASEEDWFSFRGRLIRGVRTTLMASCGEVYGALVIECLSIDAFASDESLREMYAKLSARLAQCRA